MRNLFLVLVLFLFVACSKTPLLESSEAMVGTWIHYTSAIDAHRIIINEDGSGSMEWVSDGDVNKGTKVRDWYLEDNMLIFGKAAFNGESYEIIKYPTVAWEELINYYDTIPEITRYVILDQQYYAEE